MCPLLAWMLGAVRQPRMTSACCNMLTPLTQVLTLPMGTLCEGKSSLQSSFLPDCVGHHSRHQQSSNQKYPHVRIHTALNDTGIKCLTFLRQL